MLTIAFFLDIYSFLPLFFHIYTFLRMNKTWKNKKKIIKKRGNQEHTVSSFFAWREVFLLLSYQFQIGKQDGCLLLFFGRIFAFPCHNEPCCRCCWHIAHFF